MSLIDDLTCLFFATTERVGRQLVDRPRGDNVFGPWRDRRDTETGREWSFRALTADMIDLHLAGSLLYRGERARLQTYGVSDTGLSIWTAIDLDVTAGGSHSDQPQHFATTQDAISAAQLVVDEAHKRGITAWPEITKSAGVRVWVFLGAPIPAADANAFGRLLVTRAGLHGATEVFPNTLRPYAAPVLLPYAGVAANGRQVIVHRATFEPMSCADFATAALAARTDAAVVLDVVEQAVVAGEVKRLSEPRERDRTTLDSVTDEEAERRWKATLKGCNRLRTIVEHAEAGRPLDYFDWATRLLPHLRSLGEWGHGEFHRLSAFDPRYRAAECEDKFDSIAGAPTRCEKMGCGRDPYRECGLPPKNVSPAYFAAAPVGVSVDEAWGDPILFGDKSLPPFPIEVLPPAVADYICDVAGCTQVPVDMPAMLGLAVLAAACARRFRVQIGETHSEPTNLYVCVVMEPGSRKSATLEQITAPLRAFEREAFANMEPVISASRTERDIQDNRIRDLRAAAAKAKSPLDREKLKSEIQTITRELTDVPLAPRLLADDVTPEKLGSVMALQSGVMGIFSAEGGIFGTLAGRYSEGKANLDLFLKAHAGEEYRCDRQGRGSEHIRSACLTIGLTVQTDVIASMAQHASFRGRGLLGRFLYSLPEDLVGTRRYQNKKANAVAADRYSAVLGAILRLPPADPVDPVKRHMLSIEGPALVVWAEFADDIELRQTKGADLYDVRDWASKLAGAAARIAACLHMARHALDVTPWLIPISHETVLAAWSIADYLIPHAQTAYGRMGAEPAVGAARRVLEWIKRTGCETFSHRDCSQALRSKDGPADLTKPIDLLCEHHYIRQLPTRSVGAQGGRPRSPEYEVHPSLKTFRTAGSEVKL